MYCVAISSFAFAQKPKPEGVLQLLCERPKNNLAAGKGPRQALRQVACNMHDNSEKRRWLEEARLDAVLGSCPYSLASVKSGLRCYLAFAGRHTMFHYVSYGCCSFHVVSLYCADALACGRRPVYFPPALDTLLAWSATFRSEGTLSNYFGFVKTGCLLVGASTEVCISLCFLTGLCRYVSHARYFSLRL